MTNTGPIAVTVPMSKVAREFTATVTVSGVRTFDVRLWVGLALFRLGVLVMPITTKVEVKQ